MKEKTYLEVNEVMEILGVRQCKGYEIIRALNEELKAKGFVTVPGKVSRKYFNEKYYG